MDDEPTEVVASPRYVFRRFSRHINYFKFTTHKSK